MLAVLGAAACAAVTRARQHAPAELMPLGVSTRGGQFSAPGWYYEAGKTFEGYEIQTFPRAEVDLSGARAWCEADQRCEGFVMDEALVRMKRFVPPSERWVSFTVEGVRGAARSAGPNSGIHIKPQCGTPMHPHESDGDYGITGYGFHAAAHYFCYNNLLLVGQRTRKCLAQTDPVTGQRSGYWSGSSPMCEPDPCTENPLPFAHGRVTVADEQRADGTTVRIATYSCKKGYALVGGGQVSSGVAKRVCANGHWLDTFGAFQGVDTTSARCLRACDRPPFGEVLQGSFQATGHVEGSFAEVRCADGYRFASGSKTWLCRSGRWQPPDDRQASFEQPKWRGQEAFPVCEAMGCSEPTQAVLAQGLYAARVPLQANGLYAYGTTLHFSCSSGFRHFGGTETSTCLPDGTWSDDTKFNANCEQVLRCEDITCDMKFNRMVTHKRVWSRAACKDGSGDAEFRAWCASVARDPVHHFEVKHLNGVSHRHHHCSIQRDAQSTDRKCECFCWDAPKGTQVEEAARHWKYLQSGL